MRDILYNVDEKLDWERMLAILRQFDVEEQNRIYGVIEGAQLVKDLKKARKEEQGA